MTAELATSLTVDGSLQLLEFGRWPFHRFELVDGVGEVRASLGRRGWIKVYLGSGQRLELSGGMRGRIVGRAVRRSIVPVVVDSDRSPVARAHHGPGGTYLIDTATEGFVLVPDRPTTWRSRSPRWELRSWDEPVARLQLRPRTIQCHRPLPIGAVLLAFTVMDLAVPGEEDLGLRPTQWYQR